MKFEEKLNELISEAEVPDELAPHNIAKMLKAQNARSKMESEHRTSKSGPNISVLRRTIIIRTAAAAAACAVFVFGMTAYNANRASNTTLTTYSVSSRFHVDRIFLRIPDSVMSPT